MRNPQYTKLRGQRYWFQLRVPRDLRNLYGKHFIQENLHTSDRRRAASLALERAGVWKQEFERDRAELSTDTPRDIYLHTKWRLTWIQRSNADPDSREAAIEALRNDIIEKEVERQRVSHEDEIEKDRLSAAAVAALDALRDFETQRAEPRDEYSAPTSEVARRFLEDRQHDPAVRLTNQTVAQMEAVFRLFADHISDGPLAAVRRPVVASFIDELKRLPPSWGRRPSAKSASLGQLLAERSSKGGLSARTINRYVSSLMQLWRWAEVRGEVRGPNPFDGFRERVRRNPNAHVPWTIGGIASYFAHHDDAGKRGDPNPLHWLPKIALLSGMRLNEICSLEVDDIKDAEGVAYFDITEGKTDSAVRVVPVHSALLPLIDLSPSRGFIFSNLTAGGPDRKRSWNIGKVLGRQFDRFEGASDFHGLRKTATETWERAGVQETAAAQILGHKRPGMTYGVYSPNGLRIDQKRELVEKLSVLLPGSSAFGA